MVFKRKSVVANMLRRSGEELLSKDVLLLQSRGVIAEKLCLSGEAVF